MPNILRFVGRSCQSTEPLYGSDALSACQVSDLWRSGRQYQGSREPRTCPELLLLSPAWQAGGRWRWVPARLPACQGLPAGCAPSAPLPLHGTLPWPLLLPAGGPVV